MPNKAVAAILVLVVGGGILGLAVPQTYAAFSLLLVEPIRQSLQRERDIPIGDLLKLHEAQDSVLGLSGGPGQLYVARSRTESAIARTYPEGSQKSARWREAAERSTERALLVAPADPYAWARLSNLRLLTDGDERAAKDALVMSLLTGPHETPLVFPRIRYAIRVWDRLSVEERGIMNDQIRWAERIDRKQLVGLAERGGKSMMVILPAVAEDFPRFEGFIKALNQ
jgi:hypothetical protein